MSPLYEVAGTPEVADPVLVIALEGWIDAGFGAAAATAHLLQTLDTSLLATFDSDALLDQRSRRPVMHLVEGVNTGLSWPATEIRQGRAADGADVLLLVGAEPDLRWREFVEDVVELAEELGTRLAVGLGAYPAPVPHTRPTRLACTATSPELAARASTVRATIDVPAGAEAAIERRCAERDLPAVGLWAQVPHYVATMAYPAASAALIDGLGELAGLRIDAGPLHDAATALGTRLDALVAENAEHVEMVRTLEAAVDAEGGGTGGLGGPLPSGDELAAELQRFLRRVDRGEGEH